MPFFRDFSDADAQLLVWRCSEGEVFPAQELLSPEDEAKIKDYPQRKVQEVLMIRQLLRQSLPAHRILYREGAPYLQPKSYEISISHSYPYAVLGYSQRKIGVDVECLNPKLLRLKDKFLNPNEKAFVPRGNELEYLAAVWSVKESLYKMHHTKHWSLKKHYEVFPFSEADLGAVRCRVYDENGEDNYLARVIFFDDYVLTIVLGE